MIWPHGTWNVLPDLPTKVVIASGTVYLLRRLDERERVEVLVPGGDEGEQPGRHQAGRDQRQQHLVEDLKRRRARRRSAASSRSPGRPRMKLVSTQTVNGSVKIM